MRVHVTAWKKMAAGVLVVSLLGLGACTPNSQETRPVAEAYDLAPRVSVEDGAEEIDPSVPVRVEMNGDGISSVVMTNAQGKEVQGELSPDGTSWTTTEPLGYSRTYTVTATGNNGSHTQTEFSTIEPDATVSAFTDIADGSTVGVGKVISINLSSAPTNRKAVEEAITVTTTPHVEGAFHWVNPRIVRWRPATFWEPGTQVSVDANLYGVELGDNVYGDTDLNFGFTVGDRMESFVDGKTLQMRVEKNGEVVREFPVSLGGPSFPTANGIYLVGDRNPHMVMDSTTYGLSLENGGYVTPVDWATQLSWSGIYLHSAPWALWALGSVSQSHGCVNATPADAKWFLENSKPGDVVHITGTNGGTLPALDGLGDWNMDWEQWSQGNADQTW